TLTLKPARTIRFMAFSMFQDCVPVITQMLNGMVSVVDKATAHVAEKELDELALLQARLFPNMFTLGRQIRQATDFGPTRPRVWPAWNCRPSPKPMRHSPRQGADCEATRFHQGVWPGADRRHGGEKHQLRHHAIDESVVALCRSPGIDARRGGA